MDRVFKYLANTALAILIVIQTGVLLLMKDPNILREKLQDAISEQTRHLDLDVRLGYLAFTPWNRVYCMDTYIGQASAPDTRFAKLGQIKIGIAPLSILSGKPQVTSVQLHGADVYCPALHSPTGSQETILEDLSCTLQAKKGNWLLKNLSFRLHNSTVSGAFPQGIPFETPDEKPVPGKDPLLPIFYNFLAKLYALQPHFALLDAPSLQLSSVGTGTIDIELTARGAQYPEVFNCGNITLFTQINPDPKNFQFSAPLVAKLDNTLFRKQFRANQVHVHYPAPTILGGKPEMFPLLAKVSTTGILFNNEPAGRFIGDIRMDNPDDLELHGTLGFDNSYLALDSQIRLDAQSVEAKARINLHPTDLKHFHAFIPRKYLDVVKFRNPVKGSIAATLAEGWKPTNAQFKLETGQLVVMDVPLNRLQASGYYTPGNLRLDNFSIGLKPGNVSGELDQNLENLDYRLRLHGEFFPYQINPWMMDWWDDLWGRFKFTGLPVKGDFSLEGRWDDLTRRDIFGEAHIFTASYKGVPFSKVTGRLRSIPKYTELFDLSAKFQSGHADGSISWILHPTKRDRLSSQRFSLQGQLLPETAGKLFGKDVTNALADFDTKEPAQVLSSGVIYGNEPPEFLGPDPKDTYTIQCKAKEVAYHSIPLQDLNINFEANGPGITIRPMNFRFAGGRAEGWLTHGKTGSDDTPMEISLDLKDANKKAALQHLSQSPRMAGKIKAPSADSSEKAILESFQLQARGHPDDFTSFVGKGKIRLQDPDLAKVNMLSLLSKELTGLTLPLISYKFNKMETGFVLKNKHLVIEPGPLLISGTSAKVEAKGKINLTNSKLDFRVKLLPLGIPLAGILEMRLGGNLDKPVWNPSMLPPGIQKKRK